MLGSLANSKKPVKMMRTRPVSVHRPVLRALQRSFVGFHIKEGNPTKPGCPNHPKARVP
jgi:hypothetical protein